MRELILGVFAVASIALGFPSRAEDEAAAWLDKAVPAERQKALGLDKLSQSQREGLAQLLLETYQAGFESGQAEKRASEAPTAAPTTPQVVESKISGAFEGWQGETIVKLMNGQIWKQTEYYYHYHYAFMPDVIVYQSGGGYKMQVKGIDRAVAVLRLN